MFLQKDTGSPVVTESGTGGVFCVQVQKFE